MLSQNVLNWQTQVQTRQNYTQVMHRGAPSGSRPQHLSVFYLTLPCRPLIFKAAVSQTDRGQEFGLPGSYL